MSPAALVLPTVLAALLLYLPGWVVLRAAGRGSLVAVGAAPAVGVLAIVAVGAVGHVSGLGSSLVVGLPVLVVLTAFTVLVLRRLRRGAARQHVVDGLRWVAPSVTAAFLVVAVGLARAMGRPDAWPQMPDAIFHVGSVTWMVRHDSAWIGDATSYLGAPSFAYPGAWHGLVSVVSMWSGADPLVASHAVVLVVAGLVWPVALTVLAADVLGSSRAVLVVAPLSALLFVGLPYAPLSWGVLWPYLLSVALFPLVLAGARAAARPAASRRDRLDAAVLAGAALAAASLAHPSAFLLSALVVPVVLIETAAGRPSVTRRAALVTTYVVAVVALWTLAPAGMVAPGLALPQGGPVDGAVALLTALSPSGPVALGLLVVVLVGTIVALRQPGRRWVPAALLATLAVVALSPMAPPAVRARLLWPWFSDGVRLQSVLAVFGTLVVCGLVVTALRGRDSARAVGVAAALLVCVVVAPVFAGLVKVGSIYQPGPDRPSWADAQEIADLRELATAVPEGAVVAADPLTGGTQLYRFRDVRLVFPTEKVVSADPGLAALAARLDDVASDGPTCATTRRLGVEYVVSGGTPVRWDLPVTTFGGVDRVGPDGGFIPVRTVGEFTLWRVPECSA